MRSLVLSMVAFLTSATMIAAQTTGGGIASESGSVLGLATTGQNIVANAGLLGIAIIIVLVFSFILERSYKKFTNK